MYLLSKKANSLSLTLWKKNRVQLIDDEEQREQAETIGYYAMFEYQNGFKKAIYWSKSKMEQHALKYSQGYKARKGIHFGKKILTVWHIKLCYVS